MDNFYIWILIVFIGVCSCVISYRYGFTTGQSTCPIKYAICDNGTCVLSDVPPEIYYQNK